MKKDIRFLLTSDCNYSCSFCHNEGFRSSIKEQVLSVNDYCFLYKVYSKLEEWNGVTLSGGEPLLNSSFNDLCSKLYDYKAYITVVTNGSILHNFLSTFKHVAQINISIHTLDDDLYDKITGTRNCLHNVISNIRLLRNLYPNLTIKLNVTPCLDINWDSKFLEELIIFSKEIRADIKFTELFPPSINMVSFSHLQNVLSNIGYSFVKFCGRTMKYENGSHYIFLTRCTCSDAITNDSPIKFCQETHDLYVDCDANLLLCRLGIESVNVLSEIRHRDICALERKIVLAKKRISPVLCSERLEKYL